MDTIQILIVLFAAILHASWNVAAKFGSGAGSYFVFSYNLFSFVFSLPLVLVSIYLYPPELNPIVIAVLILTALLHFLYGVVLLKGYKNASLSIVYPIARGVGPLITCITALFLFDEQLKPIEMIGVVSVCTGVILIATRGSFKGFFSNKKTLTGLKWGVLTGCIIASYSLTDAFAVKNLFLTPILIGWMSSVGGTFLLTPMVLKDNQILRLEMSGKWKYAMFIGIASPAAYMLILFALQLGANVSMVAPLRESSLLFGTLAGMLFFKEKVGLIAWIGCLTILMGVVLIAY